MMRISSINAYAPSFGQVRKSAAKIAINKAEGNTKELKKIKRFVEWQNDNLEYDVIPSKDPDYLYEVVHADGANIYSDTRSNNLDVACTLAHNLRICNENRRLVQGILANCKED